MSARRPSGATVGRTAGAQAAPTTGWRSLELLDLSPLAQPGLIDLVVRDYNSGGFILVDVTLVGATRTESATLGCQSATPARTNLRPR